MSTTYEDKINQMYDSQLTSQKEQLKTDYETTLSEMDAQQAATQKALRQKIRDTRVDSQKAAVNDAEYYAAAGLSSGAKAQARLSRENQLLADLTTLRAAQQESDAEVERQRTLLAKEYASAIQQAQSANDLARAQALYEEAKSADAQLLAKQEAAANLMAQTGDYSRIGALYGLTPEEIAKLSGKTSGGSTKKSGGSGYDNGKVSTQGIKNMQLALGVDPDGKWGPKSRAAAGGLSADEAWQKYNYEGKLGMSLVPGVSGSQTYNQVLKDIMALNAKGRRSEIGALLEDAKAYLSPQEYQVLSNAYRNSKF